jgi:hypothetical protein
MHLIQVPPHMRSLVHWVLDWAVAVATLVTFRNEHVQLR